MHSRFSRMNLLHPWTSGSEGLSSDALTAAARGGAAVVLVTHDLNAALAIADRVVILRAGSVVSG